MTGKRKSEADRWFKQAYFDLRATRWNIQGRFYDTACFLAQQTGEKALKSFLYYNGARRTALLTHSLVEMVREAQKYLPELIGLLDQARELDIHYIPSRYPNGIPSGYPHDFYNDKVADQAYLAAEKIFSTIHTYYKKRGEETFFPRKEKE